MLTPLLHVTSAPLALEPLVLAVAAASGASKASVEPGTGAVATFLGVVRGHNQGRRVMRLEYEAHEKLALRAFERIQREVVDRWPAVRLALHHRIGRLEVGEVSAAIAAASPHRAEAFAACRYVTERVKQIAPIWKHEYFEGGDVWIEGAVANPDDDTARREAMARACA